MNGVQDQIRLLLVQVHSSVGETRRNLDRALQLVQGWSGERPDLVVLPEFFNTGYFPVHWNYEYLDLAEDDQGPTVRTFRQVARDVRTHVAVPFYEIEAPGLYYDTTVILSPEGEIVAKYRKTHPPARLSLEKIFYRGASRLPIFSLFGWRVGILICYDNYLCEPARILTLRGAELIIAPFAEVKGFHLWRSLLASRSFENGVYLAACNLVGPESAASKVVMGGQSLIIDPEGHVLSEASDETEGVISATLERSTLIEVRGRRQFLRDRRPELYAPIAQFDEDVRGLRN
jgi:predicted amidohydrolase